MLLWCLTCLFTKEQGFLLRLLAPLEVIPNAACWKLHFHKLSRLRNRAVGSQPAQAGIALALTIIALKRPYFLGKYSALFMVTKRALRLLCPLLQEIVGTL